MGVDYYTCAHKGCNEVIHDCGDYRSLELTLENGEDESGYFCDDCGDTSSFIPMTEDKYLVKFLWKRPTAEIFSPFSIPAPVGLIIIDYIPSFGFALIECNYSDFKMLQSLTCRAMGCGAIATKYEKEDKKEKDILDLGEPSEDEEWMARAWAIITPIRKRQGMILDGTIESAHKIFSLIGEDADECVNKYHREWFEIPLNKEEELEQLVCKIKEKEEELLQLKEKLKIMEAYEDLHFYKWFVELKKETKRQRDTPAEKEEEEEEEEANEYNPSEEEEGLSPLPHEDDPPTKHRKIE